MSRTGVYAIRCTINGKVYVGSASVSIPKRWYLHKSQLRAGRHANRYLQAAWGKHGEAAFEFVVLEQCEPAHCLAREQVWIDEMRAAQRAFGYNLRPKAANNLGLKFSEESRAKVAAALRGRKASAETRLRISIAARARGISRETLEKAHAANRGKPISAERKARQSAALRGRKHTPERIAKQAATLRGYKHSAEVCVRMSAGQKGKKHSDARPRCRPREKGGSTARHTDRRSARGT